MNNEIILKTSDIKKHFTGTYALKGVSVELKKGEILEVVSECPQSINNIPLDARNHGYTVLDIQQDGPTIRYLIQK